MKCRRVLSGLCGWQDLVRRKAGVLSSQIVVVAMEPFTEPNKEKVKGGHILPSTRQSMTAFQPNIAPSNITPKHIVKPKNAAKRDRPS